MNVLFGNTDNIKYHAIKKFHNKEGLYDIVQVDVYRNNFTCSSHQTTDTSYSTTITKINKSYDLQSILLQELMIL